MGVQDKDLYKDLLVFQTIEIILRLERVGVEWTILQWYPRFWKVEGLLIALVSPVGSISRAAVEISCGNHFCMDGNGGESPRSNCSFFNILKIFWVSELEHNYKAALLFSSRSSAA